jgi:hypothetical protein
MSCKRTPYAKMDESSSTGSYLITHLAMRNLYLYNEGERPFYLPIPTIERCLATQLR